MADQPVQIRDPDGRVVTVQRSSLPLYLRRGCVEVSQAELDVETEARLDELAEDFVTTAWVPHSTRLTDPLPDPDPEPINLPSDGIDTEES